MSKISAAITMFTLLASLSYCQQCRMVLNNAKYMASDLSTDCSSAIEKIEKLLGKTQKGQNLIETLVDIDSLLYTHTSHIKEEFGDIYSLFEKINRSKLDFSHSRFSVLSQKVKKLRSELLEKELNFNHLTQDLVKFCSEKDILHFSFVMENLVTQEMDNIPESLASFPVEKRNLIGFSNKI